MWLKILSPSPRSTKDNRRADTNSDAVSKDRLHKQTKVKALVKNGKTKALKMKQGSSKLLVTAKQQLQSRLAEQPNEQEDTEAELQPIKTTSASTDGSTPSSADEGFTRRYWVHSATPPHKTSRPEGPEELLWNDLDSAWPDLGSTPNEPELAPKVSEPTPKGPDPIFQQQKQQRQHQQQQKHFPCDVSVLTDDLNSVPHGQPIISLEDVKTASKAALLNALWCGGIVVEAGKTAGVAIYEKSVQVDGMPCVSTSPNDLEAAAALETASTTTHTTSGSSMSSANKSQQQKQGPRDEHKAVIEKRLTQKAKNARRIRRNRLVSQNNNKKRKSQPKRSAQIRNREVSSNKESPPTKDLIVVDQESTIFIEEGDDCFLMTKDDYDDLIDTFQSLMGKKAKGSSLSKEQGDLCDCHIAKDVLDWFMSTPKSSSSQGTSREHAEFVNQAATAPMWKDPEQLWKTIMDHDPSSAAVAATATATTATTATSFVADDMRGSQDTSDSNWSGRTPKIQNIHTKFEDKDMTMESTTPSPALKSKTKAVPIHSPPPLQPILETVNSIIEKDQNEEDSLGEDPTVELGHEFQPTDTIRTDDLVVAYGGESGQSEDTIETVLVSDEKFYGSGNREMVLEQVDTEYGEDYVSSDSEDEDDSIFSVPIDEATDATQYANGFMFDTKEKKYGWDHGHYKMNSRDASKMPTILEVDIGTIVLQNNGDDEEDGFSHDLSSITPHTMDYSIETTLSTAGGGAISPVPPLPTMTMMHNVNKPHASRKVEIGRRLEELETELSQLQGQYTQSNDACHTVESNLTSPPASLTDWRNTRRCDHHGGVEEHKEGFDEELHDEEGVMSV
ncbi:MAG: hypothetical protein SGBAC_008023 [Bacillariaceae sp.]